jgi:hypothetical protein
MPIAIEAPEHLSEIGLLIILGAQRRGMLSDPDDDYETVLDEANALADEFAGIDWNAKVDLSLPDAVDRFLTAKVREHALTNRLKEILRRGDSDETDALCKFFLNEIGVAGKQDPVDLASAIFDNMTAAMRTIGTAIAESR